jgi:lactoylglutathione lyase
MDLAKPHIDIGLFTNDRAVQLKFWGEAVGLPYEQMLKLGGGVQQHRFGVHGSVVKVNDARDPLPPVAPAGFCVLLIAKHDLAAPCVLCDPDGSPVELVPKGHRGVEGIAVRLAANDVAVSHRFYSEALAMTPLAPDAVRCGDSVVFITQSPTPVRAGAMKARGFRYITIQVRSCDAEHARLLGAGAVEGHPPTTLGTTARISFVRDPDGNWIEISERASLTAASVVR